MGGFSSSLPFDSPGDCVASQAGSLHTVHAICIGLAAPALCAFCMCMGKACDSVRDQVHAGKSEQECLHEVHVILGGQAEMPDVHMLAGGVSICADKRWICLGVGQADAPA